MNVLISEEQNKLLLLLLLLYFSDVILGIINCIESYMVTKLRSPLPFGNNGQKTFMDFKRLLNYPDIIS